MKKVGILGGTFNPPHIGHFIMANEVKQALKLDEVRFMPNAIPPHKSTSGATDAQRVRMLELGIGNRVGYSIEMAELERGGVSYTFETMQSLVSNEAETIFYFIIGGDSIDTLHTWYRIDDLVKLVHFVGVRRPGTSAKSTYPVKLVASPEVNLSSTILRQRFKKGESVAYLMPDTVETYIREEGLYGSSKLT